jgi:hypothetical protein
VRVTAFGFSIEGEGIKPGALGEDVAGRQNVLAINHAPKKHAALVGVAA